MRKLALLAASFAAAVVLCCYALSGTTPLWLGGLCALLALSALFLRDNKRTRALLITLGAAAGFLWFALWTAIFVTPAMALADTTATLEATVLDYPAPTESGISLDLRLEDGTAVRLYLRGDCEASPGDTLSFTAKCKRADILSGEENSYYTSRGVFLVAYAEEGDVECVPAQRTPLRYLPRVWANRLKTGISAVFSEEHAALLHAVTLGDKSGLPDGVISLFNRSGLSHLLVVSGLHMSILLWVLTRVLIRNKRLAAVVGGLFLILFTLMVGGTPSAIRAALMNGLVLLAPFLRRETDSPTSLGAALLVLLLQNPYAAANVSLQLSFASLAGILLVADPLQSWLMERTERPKETRVAGCLRKILWSSVAMSLGAMLFTVPILALWFGVVSILSPVANLLCLWAAVILLAGGLLAGLLALLSPVVAMPWAFVTGFVCRYVLWVTKLVGSLPFAALSMESIYYRIWLVALYAVVLVIFLLRKERRKQPILLLCSPALLLIAAFLLTRVTYTAPSLTVTALDVGQGAATAFYTEGRAALVDCGGSGADGAGDVAADYFQSLGVSTLDLLVFTHLHDDHFNGADELFARMDIRAVAIPATVDEYDRYRELEELAAAEGAEIRYVTDTVEVSVGDTTFTLIPPLGSGTSNEEGLFVLCSAGDFDALITGDADSAVEAMLVKYYNLPDVELLLVGHHGSNGSTSSEFLNAIRPETAIISVGYNSYGHPRAEVLERLGDAGAEIFRTDLHGSVTVSVNGDGTILN